MKKTSTHLNSGFIMHRVCFFVLLCCLFLQPANVFAEKAFIEDMIVTNSNEDLLFYCMVKNCFSSDMDESIQNGLPVTFTFFINLYQVRNVWPDKKIASYEFDRTLTYDNLKQQYNITYSYDENNATATVQSLPDAKMIMSEVNGFRVTSLNKLVQNGEYLLEVKARLAKKTLPLNFHYLIPFWSLRDIETDWFSMEFRY